MMETWKDIVGFEGLYRISNEGNILSLLTGKVLSPSYISSCCTGKRRTAFGFVWKYLNN